MGWTPSRSLRDEVSQKGVCHLQQLQPQQVARGTATEAPFPLHAWSSEGPSQAQRGPFRRDGGNLVWWLWGLHTSSLPDPRLQALHLGTLHPRAADLGVPKSQTRLR